MRHVDNTARDGRRLTVLCYLNPDYCGEHGGALKVYPADDELGERGQEVLPAVGRCRLAPSSPQVEVLRAWFQRLQLRYSESLPSFKLCFQFQFAPLYGGRHYLHVLLRPDPARGKAVHADPVKPTLKAPGTKRFKLTYDEVLSSFAFKLNLRHCIEVLPSFKERHAFTVWYYDESEHKEAMERQGDAAAADSRTAHVPVTDMGGGGGGSGGGGGEAGAYTRTSTFGLSCAHFEGHVG